MEKSQDFYNRLERVLSREDEQLKAIYNHKTTIKKLKDKRHFKPYDDILKLLRKLKSTYYLNELPTKDKTLCLLVLDDYFSPIGQLTVIPAEYFNHHLFDGNHYTLNINLNDMLSYTSQERLLQLLTKYANKYNVSLHTWIDDSGNTKTLFEKYLLVDTKYQSRLEHVTLYKNHTISKGWIK